VMEENDARTNGWLAAAAVARLVVRQRRRRPRAGVADVVATWSGVPVTRLYSEEGEKRLHLEDTARASGRAARSLVAVADAI
jgi:MYXO-CTERM domain-containing protein